MSFVERLSSFRGDFYRVCIHEYFWLVLCWEVCPLSECPLSEDSLQVFSCLIQTYIFPLVVAVKELPQLEVPVGAFGQQSNFRDVLAHVACPVLSFNHLQTQQNIK